MTSRSLEFSFLITLSRISLIQWPAWCQRSYLPGRGFCLFSSIILPSPAFNGVLFSSIRQALDIRNPFENTFIEKGGYNYLFAIIAIGSNRCHLLSKPYQNRSKSVFLITKAVVIVKQSWGGGGGGGKRKYLCIKIRYSPLSLKFQGSTSQHDTQAVRTKGISKIIL